MSDWFNVCKSGKVSDELRSYQNETLLKGAYESKPSSRHLIKKPRDSGGFAFVCGL